MKKFLLPIFATILMIAFSACSYSIEDDVAASREDCPFEIDEGMTCTDIYLQGDNVVYLIEIDEDLYDFEYFIENKRELRETLLDDDGDEDFAEAAKLCVDNDKGMIYKLVGSYSGETVSVRISPAELKCFI